jgi:hypothetical protein
LRRVEEEALSIEETKHVVEAFVETSEGSWLSEAVQLTSPTRVVATGRDAVRDALARLHSPELADHDTTQTRVVVGDGIAAVEIRPWPREQHREHRGEHWDEHRDDIGNRQPRGRSAACFYEVSGGEIVRASVHLDSTIDTPTIDTETIDTEVIDIETINTETINTGTTATTTGDQTDHRALRAKD